MNYTRAGFPIWDEEFDREHFTPEEIAASDERVARILVPPMAANERPGKMLKGLRLREELTQAQLAKAIGVPQGHISAYEKNARPIPREKAAKLAEVLHSVPENFY